LSAEVTALFYFAQHDSQCQMDSLACNNDWERPTAPIFVIIPMFYLFVLLITWTRWSYCIMLLAGRSSISIHSIMFCFGCICLFPDPAAWTSFIKCTYDQTVSKNQWILSQNPRPKVRNKFGLIKADTNSQMKSMHWNFLPSCTSNSIIQKAVSLCIINLFWIKVYEGTHTYI